MKPLLVMSAPVATRSGYGDHSRDLLRSLIKMNKFDIKVLSQKWGNCPMNALTKEKDDDIISRLHFGNEFPKQPDIWIQITVPNEFQKVGRFNIGITAGIETTHVSQEFMEGMNRMDLNIVPSEHSKGVFLNTVYDKMDKNTNQKIGQLKLEKPIEVLFEGVDLEVFKKTNMIPKTIHDELRKIPENFCFLFVGHWLQGDLGQDRKDVGGLIRTFFETFKNTQSNKPALILKTSEATFSVSDREKILKKIDEVRESCGRNNLNVYLLHGDLTQEEVNGLYNHPKVKAHISFTKGEGFGRPLLESSVSGKPVIVSNWSGHIDFLKHSILLAGKIEKVHPSAANQFVLKDSGWFYVDYLYAQKVMKEVYKHYKNFIPEARKQAKFSRDMFSLEKMDKLFSELLDKYLFKTPQPVQLKLPKLKKVSSESKEVPKIKLPKLKKVEV